MANGTIKKQGLISVVTNFPAGSFSGNRGAHSGQSLGQQQVSVPSGYRHVCNVSCGTVNLPGVMAFLDGDESVQTTTPSIYIYNAGSGSANLANLQVWILSLCEPI